MLRRLLEWLRRRRADRGVALLLAGVVDETESGLRECEGIHEVCLSKEELSGD